MWLGHPPSWRPQQKGGSISGKEGVFSQAVPGVMPHGTEKASVGDRQKIPCSITLTGLQIRPPTHGRRWLTAGQGRRGQWRLKKLCAPVAQPPLLMPCNGEKSPHRQNASARLAMVRDQIVNAPTCGKEDSSVQLNPSAVLALEGILYQSFRILAYVHISQA